MRRRALGFTLIELMVVVALVGILLVLVAPRFTNFIKLQRLKSVHSQLVTDLQLARSEAAARGVPVYWEYRVTGSMSCYTIFASAVEGLECACNLGAGAACGGDPRTIEIRTVQIPNTDSVRVSVPSGQALRFGFDAVSGGIYYATSDFEAANLREYVINASIIGDGTKLVRTTVGVAGRPTSCAPSSTLVGVNAC